MGTDRTKERWRFCFLNNFVICSDFDSFTISSFLSGWNLIFALMKHLQNHTVFGSQAYRIIPLHSQLPREDQRMVRINPHHSLKIIQLIKMITYAGCNLVCFVCICYFLTNEIAPC
jgi:hypothetical protein